LVTSGATSQPSADWHAGAVERTDAFGGRGCSECAASNGVLDLGLIEVECNDRETGLEEAVAHPRTHVPQANESNGVVVFCSMTEAGDQMGPGIELRGSNLLECAHV
jgi:hypothetical protein